MTYGTSPFGHQQDGESTMHGSDMEQHSHESHEHHSSEPISDIDRRTFLTLMGASFSLAGLVGCRRPEEHIVPYVSKPEEITVGLPQKYATSMPLGTESYRLLVESHEGRPTKIAGNPMDATTMGATNVWASASVLNLYDPDRSQNFLERGQQSSRAAFTAFWTAQYADFVKTKGDGLAMLSESFASPTMDRLKKDFLSVFPNATFAVYEPVSDENILKATEIAFGSKLVPVYDFSKADLILSLDADFLGTESYQVQNTLGFTSRRRVTSEKDSMNRLYLVESHLTQTSSMADHRLTLQSRLMGTYLSNLVIEMESLGVKVPVTVTGWSQLIDEKWLGVVAKELVTNRGRSLVIAGRHQPPEVHALAIAVNAALGNIGNTVQYLPLAHGAHPSTASLADLVTLIGEKKVKTLAILGGNPVHNAPADLAFPSALADVQSVIHLSPSMDETSSRATWHVPMRHYLESWGDVSAIDGTLGVIQPLIAPLYEGMNSVEMLSLLATGKESKDYDIVREAWKEIVGNDEPAWRRVLHDGVYRTGLPADSRTVNMGAITDMISKHPFAIDYAFADALEIVFQLSPALHDGRFANNGWLQEFPDPVTKVTWDNLALVGRKTANELGFQDKDIVRISLNGHDIGLPIWIVPGIEYGTVVVSLGYGRTNAGRVGNNVGVNANRLRSSTSPYMQFGAKLTRIRGAADIACVQDHHGLDREAMARRGVQERLPQIFREATLEEFRKHPEFAKERVEMPALRSMWDEHQYTAHDQWGMSIDLNACTGCGACTIACQSENNIPIVGKKQVLNGREMHWIRVDRYYSGTEEKPNVHVQPVACVQCEMAPCEQVCPVAATSHDEEGLNGMTYNRCIGTRYCLNNCPYKVRRFNFFNYTKEMPESLQMAQNPEVTVRFRGVMEKCTFCVQRISAARILSKREGREIEDGEIRTACEESCPAQAIVFGNIKDPKSKVAGLKKQSRDYALLGELNLRPRLTYLAKLRNPNPEMGGAA